MLLLILTILQLRGQNFVNWSNLPCGIHDLRIWLYINHWNKIRFSLTTWHMDPILLNLQEFEFLPMPKLTEVCIHRLDPIFIPQIQQLFDRKFPFVKTEFSNDDTADYYGIAVPGIEN